MATLKELTQKLNYTEESIRNVEDSIARMERQRVALHEQATDLSNQIFSMRSEGVTEIPPKFPAPVAAQPADPTANQTVCWSANCWKIATRQIGGHWFCAKHAALLAPFADEADEGAVAQPADLLASLRTAVDGWEALTSLSAMTKLYELQRIAKVIITSEFGAVTPYAVVLLRDTRIKELSPTECVTLLAKVAGLLANPTPYTEPAAQPATLEDRLTSGKPEDRIIDRGEIHAAISLIEQGVVKPIEGHDFKRMPTAQTQPAPEATERNPLLPGYKYAWTKPGAVAWRHIVRIGKRANSGETLGEHLTENEYRIAPLAGFGGDCAACFKAYAAIVKATPAPAPQPTVRPVKLTAHELRALSDFAKYESSTMFNHGEYVWSSDVFRSSEPAYAARRAALTRAANKGYLDSERPMLASFKMNDAGRAALEAANGGAK